MLWWFLTVPKDIDMLLEGSNNEALELVFHAEWKQDNMRLYR